MSTPFSKTLLVWSGSIVGLSFIATPVKFRASRLTMPVAIEVGKVTFHAKQNIEWLVFGSLALHTYLIENRTAANLHVIAALGVVLGMQTFVLLPQLDARSDAIITQQKTAIGPQSRHHVYFVVAEVLKLALTAAGGCLL